MTPPLGPLEFKAEDFASVGWKPGQEEHAAEIANRLLAERLERAEKVRGVRGKNGQFVTVDDSVHNDCCEFFSARLVCIEKLGEGK